MHITRIKLVTEILIKSHLNISNVHIINGWPPTQPKFWIETGLLFGQKLVILNNKKGTSIRTFVIEYTSQASNLWASNCHCLSDWTAANDFLEPSLLSNLVHKLSCINVHKLTCDWKFVCNAAWEALVEGGQNLILTNILERKKIFWSKFLE